MTVPRASHVPLQIFPMPLQSTAAIVVDDDGLIVCVSLCLLCLCWQRCNLRALGHDNSKRRDRCGALKNFVSARRGGRGGEGGGREIPK